MDQAPEGEQRGRSAIAMGTVRGAQLALGRGGRVHVAWMGSGAVAKVDGKFAPMLYARMKDDGGGFEREKNVLVNHPGLDGGGSVAADQLGNVFVGWHAPEVIGAGEQSRRVWIARSKDDGKSFEPEVGVSDPATGACGCCGMQMTVVEGRLLILYRGAAQVTHRGMYLVDVGEDLQGARSREIAPMEAGTCIMSTAAFGAGPGGIALAWETNGRVAWASIAKEREIHNPTQAGPGQKHPALAINGGGDVLFVWTEGTGWNRGGTVRWEGYSVSGTAVPGLDGNAGDLGVWGSVAAFATTKGNFVIVY